MKKEACSNCTCSEAWPEYRKICQQSCIMDTDICEHPNNYLNLCTLSSCPVFEED